MKITTYKNHAINLRIDDDLYNFLVKFCNENNYTISDGLRRILFNFMILS